MHPSGSSPLTRGKPDRILHHPEAPRLIPAHAGKTRSARPSRSRSGAHPRSRGENLAVPPLDKADIGSSPLTRGKLGGWQWYRDPRRLIPAHAGKTVLRALGAGACAAHPRSRGENTRFLKVALFQAGSSPLTRGKRLSRLRGRSRAGLIPAHAGKTAKVARKASRERAHPRSRGENVYSEIRTILGEGSSPLTRGKHFLCEAHGHLCRLIPAHAGKTKNLTGFTDSRRAHPRSRGENVEDARAGDLVCGSSPLTRGKRKGEAPSPCQARLIPAHAGKTWWPPTGWELSRAHPRSRGENALSDGQISADEGSSPLTRGKPKKA